MLTAIRNALSKIQNAANSYFITLGYRHAAEILLREGDMGIVTLEEEFGYPNR